MLVVDLVFVSLEPWDEIWRRNQFVCTLLLTRNTRLRILFVEPALDISNAIRTGRWSLLKSSKSLTQEFPGRLTCHRPIKLLPNSLSLGRRFNEWLERLQVREAMEKNGFNRPTLWINAHYAGHLAGRLGERAVIYDITDDWTELKQCNGKGAKIREQDAALCGAADAVIVCSERLAEVKRLLSRSVHLIPNGVDSDHYRCVLEGSGPLPVESQAWRRPVYGYTGTLHPERLDLDLLEKIARDCVSCSFVLIGPSYLSPHETARLRACGNIYLPGPFPYSRIPELMRAFDVCIVPHRVTAFTESLNPIKLWEYLAAGKPIVSTDIAGFRDYPDLVKVAHNSGEFVDGMRAALSEDLSVATARRVEARKHSWSQRIEQIEQILLPLAGDIPPDAENMRSSRKSANWDEDSYHGP